MFFLTALAKGMHSEHKNIFIIGIDQILAKIHPFLERGIFVEKLTCYVVYIIYYTLNKKKVYLLAFWVQE